MTGLALFVTQECSPLSSLSRSCSRMKEFPSQVLKYAHPWEFIRGEYNTKIEAAIAVKYYLFPAPHPENLSAARGEEEMDG